MTDIVIIRFVKMASPYNEGEVAGFSREHARKLLKKGVAVLHNGGKVSSPKTQAEQFDKNKTLVVGTGGETPLTTDELNEVAEEDTLILGTEDETDETATGEDDDE